VQLAKAAGAHVTAVCSAANAPLVAALGADRVLDYAAVDFTKDSARYDLVVDIVGTAPYARSRLVLKPKGRLALVLATLAENLRAAWVGLTTRHRVIAGPVSILPGDLQQLADLAAAGALRVVIDAQFPFERVADAYRRVASGRKRGAVVLNVSPGEGHSAAISTCRIAEGRDSPAQDHPMQIHRFAMGVASLRPATSPVNREFSREFKPFWPVRQGWRPEGGRPTPLFASAGAPFGAHPAARKKPQPGRRRRGAHTRRR
jgi:hypothetical protein